MIKIETADDRLTLRFSAGKVFTLFGLFFPLLALGLIGLGVFLPHTATLSCSRARGQCTIDERSFVSSKSSELALADLRGAHVEPTDTGANHLILDVAGSHRDLGKAFHSSDLTTEMATAASTIGRFLADPSSPTLHVSAPIRNFDVRYWSIAGLCFVFGLACLSFRTRGTLSFSRSEVIWEERRLFSTKRDQWATSEIRAVNVAPSGFYVTSIALDLGDRCPTVIRQWRSGRGQKLIDAAAASVRTFLGLRA